MSNEKIEVVVDIGPNLKNVLEKTVGELDLYNDPRAGESFIVNIIDTIKSMIVDILTIKKKNEKEVIVECPTLEKKEDQS